MWVTFTVLSMPALARMRPLFEKQTDLRDKPEFTRCAHIFQTRPVGQTAAGQTTFRRPPAAGAAGRLPARAAGGAAKKWMGGC